MALIIFFGTWALTRLIGNFDHIKLIVDGLSRHQFASKDVSLLPDDGNGLRRPIEALGGN